MIAIVGLTAALRAAATPLFNQDFYAELRMKLKRHKKPCIRKLGMLQPNCCCKKHCYYNWTLQTEDLHAVTRAHQRGK